MNIYIIFTLRIRVTICVYTDVGLQRNYDLVAQISSDQFIIKVMTV